MAATILPMSDDPVETRVDVVDERGETLDLHFQEYWVARGGRDQVKEVRFKSASSAAAAPGVLAAIAAAEAILLCPSNPIVSIDPILAVPGVAAALAARREHAAGVSPIVGGAPLRGMADRLLPSAGVEVSASGVARHYSDRELISGWVIDDVDLELADRVRATELRVAVTDTIMTDDVAAEALARVALELALDRAP